MYRNVISSDVMCAVAKHSVIFKRCGKTLGTVRTSKVSKGQEAAADHSDHDYSIHIAGHILRRVYNCTAERKKFMTSKEFTMSYKFLATFLGQSQTVQVQLHT